MKRLRWTAIVFVIAAIIVMTMMLGDGTSTRLPLAAFTVAGYTNVHPAELGWPEGWHAIIVVTNVLSIPIDCIVGSYPQAPLNTEVWPTHPAEREIDPRRLPQTVSWTKVPSKEQPEVYMPGDLTVSMRLGKEVTIGADESARFAVKLWPTNETLVQVQYRTPAGKLRKWRLALAKKVNMYQSKLLNRRRWVNFRTWDDRSYRAVTTVFQPTVTNREPVLDQQ